MQYIVKAYGDYERRLKEQEVVIEAVDEEVAYLKAWMIFPEYKELSVTRKE
jgi:hypothetical protein